MSPKIELIAIADFPMVEPGDDLARIIVESFKQTGLEPRDGDCVVIAQKVVSKAEGRYVRLNTVSPSEAANSYAVKTGKDPRLVELILRESNDVLRYRDGLIIVEHRLGYVHANAGIDESNIEQDPDNPRVLLLPADPDLSANALMTELCGVFNVRLNIVINDSAGRAWRNGIIGFAIATAGFEPVENKIDVPDLFGRPLKHTQVAVADEIAAAASLLMGQAAEGVPVVLVRGLTLEHSNTGSESLIRQKGQDLFR